MNPMKRFFELKHRRQSIQSIKAAQRERERGSASERGYDARWRKARRVYLYEHPLCIECQRQDRIRAASVVDHITPHRGNKELFWDIMNWQPLCRECHDAKTRRGE